MTIINRIPCVLKYIYYRTYVLICPDRKYAQKETPGRTVGRMSLKNEEGSMAENPSLSLPAVYTITL